MRALLAAALALFLVLAVAAPHVHAHPGGSDECATCALRHTAPARSEAPDVAPLVHAAGEAACAPGLPPVGGFPQGAVPGQSPPVSA